MDILNELYDQKLKKIGFLPRKITPESKRVIFQGVPKSGKSYYLLNEIEKSRSNALYIDMNDPRLDLVTIKQNLASFCHNNQISFLAIDNYTNELSLQLDSIEIDKIFLASSLKNSVDGFKEIELFGLDFEEFIAFSKSTNDVQFLFNRFLKAGSLIEFTNESGLFRNRRTIEILQLLFSDKIEYQIYCYLLEKNGFVLTINQIYTSLKDRLKISKDRLYKFFAQLENRYLIFAIEKINAPNAPKKIYAFDHAIRSAVTFNKNFAKTFETMVVLETIKHGKQIYYDDSIDLIIPDEKLAIIIQPFAAKDSINAKANNAINKHELERVVCVTMGFEELMEIDGVVVEAVTFWEWALR